TEEVRKRARMLEADPGRVPIPGFSGKDRMSRDDVATALGWAPRGVYHLLQGVPRHRDAQGFFYRACDVETYLLARRVKNPWTVDRKDGTYQLLSETLLIAPTNFFHRERAT